MVGSPSFTIYCSSDQSNGFVATFRSGPREASISSCDNDNDNDNDNGAGAGAAVVIPEELVRFVE